MKLQRFALTGLVFLFLHCGCAPEPVVREMPATYNPPAELMEKADRKIRAKEYDEAVDLLNELLSSFPDAPEADDAAFKCGLVLKELKKPDEALVFFEGLVASYPASPLLEDSKYEILTMLLATGKNDRVIERASDLFKPDKNGLYPVRLYLIVAAAYLNSDKPENAVKLYTMAFNHAPDSQKGPILEKIKSGIARIPPESLDEISQNIPDSFPKGYILYQSALNKMNAGQYFEATRILNEFLDGFPSHELAPEAREAVASISEQAEEQRYTIGCILPLSGRYEDLGRKAWTGIELALDRFGSREDAPRFRIVLRDTGSDPETARLAVQELARGHSAAVIGPLTAAEAEQAATEAQIQGIPIITMTQKEKITETGDYVFRNFLTPGMQAEAMASFVTESLVLTRFAILYPEENYGTTFRDLFWDAIIERGGKIVGVESYGLNLTDYKGPVNKLSGLFAEAPGAFINQKLEGLEQGGMGSEDLGQNPEAVVDFGAIFIPDSIQKAGMIIPQLAYYGISGVFILGTNLWHTPDFIRMTGGYTRNVILTDGFFAESDSPSVREFVENYRMVYGAVPGLIEAASYDNAMIVMALLGAGENMDRAALKDALSNTMEFSGVTGKTGFDETGDAKKDIYILRVKDGRFVELGRTDETPRAFTIDR